MKQFTKEELKTFDGKDGQPVYVAYKGGVYDLTGSKMWRNGSHMKRHNAGEDLTTDIKAAPHETDVLERFPKVGELAAEAPAAGAKPNWVTWLLDANPFLRRHPHPMTVHFPIVFMLAFPVFNLLYLVSGNPGFETTAFHCLAGGVFFSAIAMATGFLTWWYNYMAKMMLPIIVKIPLSVLMLVLGAVLFVWRLRSPGVMTGPDGVDVLYLCLSLAMIPLISIVGWYGATMTFPIEED